MDAPIQLRDGGRYRLRNGDIITIIKNTGESSSELYPWMSRDGVSYTNEGRFCMNSLDIIAEVIDEQEKKSMDWTIEVGKFYHIGKNKVKCILAETIPYHEWATRTFTHYVFWRPDNHTVISEYDSTNIDMLDIGPWIEPLVVRWEMVPTAYDRINLRSKLGPSCANYDDYEGMSSEWMDHIAPGWREHIGETHYRDGRVERSEA